MAELVDALVSNTSEKSCRFDSGTGYLEAVSKGAAFFIYIHNKMASVYILYSKQLKRFYTGSCLDLSYRIDQHLNKVFVKSFTAKVTDWELFFFVDDLGYDQARLIESHRKKMHSKTYITNMKKYPEIIEKLKIRFK